MEDNIITVPTEALICCGSITESDVRGCSHFEWRSIGFADAGKGIREVIECVGCGAIKLIEEEYE